MYYSRGIRRDSHPTGPFLAEILRATAEIAGYLLWTGNVKGGVVVLCSAAKKRNRGQTMVEPSPRSTYVVWGGRWESLIARNVGEGIAKCAIRVMQVADQPLLGRETAA